MKNLIFFAILLSIAACTEKPKFLAQANLQVINREISSLDEESQSLTLNAKEGSGLAILNTVNFEEGAIEFELKGENKPGESFIGLAFNIQNDSTYEAIYFRPFNFQAEEKIRREHSVQYISEPKNTWFYLRENYEGEFEADYPRKPNPDDWFAAKVIIEKGSVAVYDKESNRELLKVRRLEKTVSGKIGFWVGHNSKGDFRGLKINKNAAL